MFVLLQPHCNLTEAACTHQLTWGTFHEVSDGLEEEGVGPTYEPATDLPSFVQHQPTFARTCPCLCSAHSCLWVPTGVHWCILCSYPSACSLALIHFGACWSMLVLIHGSCSCSAHCCLFMPPLFIPTCVLACPCSCLCLPTLVGPCWLFSFMQCPLSFVPASFIHTHLYAHLPSFVFMPCQPLVVLVCAVLSYCESVSQ